MGNVYEAYRFSPNIFAPFDLAGKPIFVTIPVSDEKDSEAKMVAERKDET